MSKAFSNFSFIWYYHDEKINKRLGAVEELKNDIMLRGEVIENLKKVYDIERLAGKMAYGNGTPRDMITLKNSLSRLPDIRQVLQNVNSEYLKEIYPVEGADFERWGMMKPDIFEAMIDCFKTSKNVKRKYKKILSEY